MIISFGTLVVIFYQTNLLSQQTDLLRWEQHVSVMPYLEFEVVRLSDNWMELKILNTGLGPAQIKKATIHSDKGDLDMDLSHFFLQNFTNPPTYTVNYLNPGSMLMAGAKMALLGTSSENEPFNQFINNMGDEKFSYSIIYSSLYGDEWIWNSIKAVPVE